MGKQSFPSKAKRGNAGHLAALARGKVPGESDKKKKLKHGGVGAGNAFENLTYRSKHEVLQLGKPKGKVKRPAASLSHSLAQRQQSLLAEFGAREKANSFTDERIAETQEMDLEDKLLMRFQQERTKRAAAHSRFSMADAEDTMQLTHGGQALSTAPRKRYDEADPGYENPYAEDEDAQAAELERRSALEREGREDADMEGEDEDEDGNRSGHKSKHEVMSEVMLKSKMYRAERAVRAGEQEDLQGQLDTEFDLIRSQMEFVTQRERDAQKKAAREAEKAAQLAQKKKVGGGDDDGIELDPLEIDPTDEFVQEARMLGMDVRAKASDRLKSDEELIAQEKKRLERLEKQRLKRMRGENANDDDEDDEDDDDRPSKRRRREKATADKSKSRRPTDDDLDSNFILTGSALGDAKDENDLLSDDEDGGKDSHQMSDDEEDDDEDEEDEDEDDEEDEDEDDEDDDEDDGAVDPNASAQDDDGIKAVFIGKTPTPAPSKSAAGGAKEIFIGKDGKSSVSSALLEITAKLAGKQSGNVSKKSDSTSKVEEDPNANVPYTFPAPTTYKEFRTLLNSYLPSQHSVIIHRIKTCNHISLAPENRQKMEKFFAILLTHFRRLASDFDKLPSSECSDAKVDELIQSMDEVARHIVELSELPSMNAVVGRCFRAQLVKIRAELELPEATLKADQLLFIKFVTNVFPSSDFRHNVVTPSILLLGELLSRVSITTTSDLVKGCFGASILLHAVSSSKRLVPEVITFLHATLIHGCGIAKKETDKVAKSKSRAASNANLDLVSAFTAPPSEQRLLAALQPRLMNFTSTQQSLAVFKPLFQAKKPVPEPKDLHLPLSYLFGSSSSSASTPNTALSQQLFSTVLQLIHQSAQLWQGLESYAELMQPVSDVLGAMLSNQSSQGWSKLSPTGQTYLQHLHKYLQGSSAHAVSLRTPLSASLAPLALKQHNPLFVEGYNPTKDYDPIKERAAAKELTHKLKREKKGALRELRRDTQVIVQQQRALQDAYAAERESKRKETWAQMEEQQRDTNIMQRASKKKERKEGKKKK